MSQAALLAKMGQFHDKQRATSSTDISISSMHSAHELKLQALLIIKQHLSGFYEEKQQKKSRHMATSRDKTVENLMQELRPFFEAEIGSVEEVVNIVQKTCSIIKPRFLDLRGKQASLLYQKLTKALEEIHNLVTPKSSYVENHTSIGSAPI